MQPSGTVWRTQLKHNWGKSLSYCIITQLVWILNCVWKLWIKIKITVLLQVQTSLLLLPNGNKSLHWGQSTVSGWNTKISSEMFVSMFFGVFGLYFQVFVAKQFYTRWHHASRLSHLLEYLTCVPVHIGEWKLGNTPRTSRQSIPEHTHSSFSLILTLLLQWSLHIFIYWFVRMIECVLILASVYGLNNRHTIKGFVLHYSC